MAHLGTRIRYYREELGYTQEKFAELVGLSPNYLSALERGVKLPKLQTFIRIANQLQISSDLLLQDTLHNGVQTKSSILYNQIKDLNRTEQDKIFHVIEIMIKDSK
ncbi:MAG: helix-turn-helix transcriptional regulator [Roseburia sp.]|nr:helix-turn-helix transcriptional regulator [Roseburia sp.]